MMPFKTLRSTTRGTIRGLFGGNGWIMLYSRAVRSITNVQDQASLLTQDKALLDAQAALSKTVAA